jgi:uncharacterized protein (TIGR02246 family)
MVPILTILGAFALGALPPPRATEAPQTQAPTRASRSNAPQVRAEDGEAIRALTNSFVQAYNKGDSKALASMFKEDAEIVDVDGTRNQGREVIAKLFAETFAENPGMTIAVASENLRFLGAESAKEEGHTTITPKTGARTVRRYTVLYAKRDGRWLYDSVREDTEPLVSPHERLKEIEWLVGDWIDESADADVRVNCKWSEDGNYLLRDVSVKRHGKAVMKVSQRIGWDPLTKQFKSWEFDSDGGYGEALWALDGKRWVIKQSGVLPDGRTASATRILVQENPHRVSWVSTQEVVGGESVPDSDVYVMVKTPPAPRVKPDGQPRTTGPARRPQ